MSFAARQQLVLDYAWAIPDERAIATIVNRGPVVEIGAGAGYWAALIHAAGGDIVTYDTAPPALGPSRWTSAVWYPVTAGGPEQAANHPDRTLLLIWPPYEEPMAADTLDTYTGDTVIYVGEGHGGCTADDQFHQMLDRHWTLVDNLHIPQWFGLHDRLTIWERTRRR
jgi:hypothetical protein